MSESTTELIQTVLDGTASPAEVGELEELIQRSPEARLELESMRQLFRQIEQSADVPLPPRMKDDILTGIRTLAGTAGAAGPAISKSTLATHQLSPHTVVVPFETTKQSQRNKGVKMIERKRRNFLIGFAAVAALIAGVLLIRPPLFQAGDASGAIGAVQKHRQAQISSKDVILSDQDTVNDAKVLFGDSLEDARKLQKIGTELASMTMANRDSLQAIGAMLDSHQADLQSRFVGNMNDTLNAAESELNQSSSLFAASALDNMKGDLAAIESSLGASASLNASQMDSLSSRLGSVVADLESRLGAQAQIGAMSETLQAASKLNAQSALNSADVLGAAEKLNAAASSLDAKGILGVSLANRADHLGAMALEAHALENVEASLGAAMANKGNLQSHLGRMTDALGVAAGNLESMALGSMNARLNAQQQLGSSLASMEAMLGSSRLQSNSLDQKTLGSFHDALGSAQKTLQNLDTALQARAVSNMQAELAAVSSHLEAVSVLQAAMVENRLGAQSQLGAKGQLGAQDQLGAKGELGAQDQLGAKGELGAQGQLGAKGQLGAQGQLGAKGQLGVKGQLGAQGQLGAKGQLGAQGQLGAKGQLGSKLFSHASLASFQSYLGALSSSLESKALGARFQNRQELASQAQELQNKAAGLQSRTQF